MYINQISYSALILVFVFNGTGDWTQDFCTELHPNPFKIFALFCFVFYSYCETVLLSCPGWTQTHSSFFGPQSPGIAGMDQHTAVYQGCPVSILWLHCKLQPQTLVVSSDSSLNPLSPNEFIPFYFSARENGKEGKQSPGVWDRNVDSTSCALVLWFPDLWECQKAYWHK